MPLIDAFLGLLVALLWGANFISAKYGLSELPPLLLMFLRFTAVAAMVVPFVKRPPLAVMKPIFVLSLVLGVGHFALLYCALETGLSVSTAVITGQLGVPFACIMGIVVFKDKLGIWRTLGLVISFCGVMLVAGTPSVAGNIFGFMLVLMAAFLWGCSNILMKQLENVPILTVIGWMSLFCAPEMLLISALLEADRWQESLTHLTYISAFSITYTAIMSTIVAYSLWYYLLRKHPVSLVAPYSLLVPVFGISLAVLLLDEELTTRMMIGAAMTIGGVAIIVMRRPRTAIEGD